MAIKEKSSYWLESECSGSAIGSSVHLTATHQTQEPKPVHLSSEISAMKVNQMLKRGQVERAFLGIIRLVKEESEEMDVPEESTTAQKPK